MQKRAFSAVLVFSLFFLLVGASSCNPQNETAPEKSDTVKTDSAATPEIEKDPQPVAVTTKTSIGDTADYKIPVLSATNNIFYRYCKNEINLDVPRAWSDHQMRVSATGAAVLPSKADDRRFVIVPGGQNTELRISTSNTGSYTERTKVLYNVIDAPKPVIGLIVNGIEYTSGPVSKNSRIIMRVYPDKEFMAAFPQDAQYEISTIDVTAQLSLGAPTRINLLGTKGQDATNGISVSLGQQAKQARPGTVIFIQAEKVYRKNFQGMIMPVDLRHNEKTIMLMIK